MHFQPISIAALMRIGSLLAPLGVVCVVSHAAWSGTIEGTVRYTRPPVQNKDLKVSIDKYICGQYKADESLIIASNGGIQNAVVSLLLPPDTKKASNAQPPKVTIDQRKCVFRPHVAVVPVGGTVTFLNSDRLLHNVHGRVEANSPFNRAQPKGRAVSVTLDRPEIVRVDCDLHSWMRAWIVVTDHDFHAVTDSEGKFVLEGVPLGTHTLHVWHETLGRFTKEVQVPDRGAAHVNLQLGVREPAVGLDP